MSFNMAKDYLKKYDLEERIMEFKCSSATVSEAAKAINCEEREIGKTLSFIVDDKPILIVVSGNAKIDNSKYKNEFKTKAKMIDFDNVENLIGHKVGGVCPFGVKEGVKIYLDISLKKLKYVYPACGSDNSAVKLSVDELDKIINNEKWIDVCKE